MENLEKTLKELRNVLNDMGLSDDESDENYIKLVQIENIDRKLLETLILIHSNYKADLQAVKHSNRFLYMRLLDSIIDMFPHYKDLKEDIEELKERTAEKKWLTWPIVYKSLGVVLAITTFTYGLYLYDPKAAEASIKFVAGLLKFAF